MTGMQVKSGNWVPGGTSSEPEWTGKGTQMGGRPNTTSIVHGLLNEDGGVSGVPVHGMQGGGGVIKLTSGFTFYTATYGIK